MVVVPAAPAVTALVVIVLVPRAAREDAVSETEVQIARLVVGGLSNKEIADALYVTPATVKTHLAHIYAKLGATGRQDAVARAVALGVLG